MIHFFMRFLATALHIPLVLRYCRLAVIALQTRRTKSITGKGGAQLSQKAGHVTMRQQYLNRNSQKVDSHWRRVILALSGCVMPSSQGFQRSEHHTMKAPITRDKAGGRSNIVNAPACAADQQCAGEAGARNITAGRKRLRYSRLMKPIPEPAPPQLLPAECNSNKAAAEKRSAMGRHQL